MKFEMKKRILALALAGTTAFSVFGAAVSANAASVSSTDTKYDVDAYVHYSNVAENIYAAKGTAASTGVKYYDNSNNTLTAINDKATNTEAELNTYLASKDIKGNFKSYYKVALKATDGSDDVWTYFVATDKSGVLNYTGNSVVGTDFENALAIMGVNKVSAGTTDQSVSGSSYSYDGHIYESVDALLNAVKLTGNDAETIYSRATGSHKTAAEYEALPTKEAYKAAHIVSSPVSVPASGTNLVVVNASYSSTDGSYTERSGDAYTNWYFNADMTGEGTVTPYTTSTSIDPTTGSLKTVKNAAKVVYAYDYLPANNTSGSASTISGYWNANPVNAYSTADSLLATNASSGALTAETGRGRPNVGVRYEVVSNWIDFLDELAINQDNGYKETESEFISNYSDLYYKDPIYSSSTGALIGYNTTDLYNINTLLKDIYAKSSYASYSQANTSELVYLMQQYNKYIGNYIDKDEVASDDWGDLLLTVLNGASEDNFKKAADYKKYARKVEDLEDAYKDATTSAQIEKAEKAMYELLNSTPYTASTVSKADLNATIEGLYFNVGSAPATYTTAPSTQSNNVDYTNYNYYVATSKVTSGVYQFTTTYSRGYYSLYPMADYASSHKVAVYAGNKGAEDYTGSYATEEYEWFWNVYQLANNMIASNKYQGAIDAVNEALNKAVDELNVTTSPYATETSAKDEMVENYAGKIESDYNAGYYAKYVQANNFADKAEGKYQTRIAREIAGVAGEALTYQGTQVTVTKNDMKTVETAIKNGNAALKSIKESKDYSAAQVNALNKAIADAQKLVDLYEGSYATKAADQSVNKAYTTLVGDKDQMVKSDLTAAISAIDSAINYSNVVMDWSKNDAGKWQYGTEDGYLSNGWNKIGATWYYFNADGTAKQSEWFQENGKWYYFNSNCGAAYNWCKVDGNWYYFNGDNAMRTGWLKKEGSWYYLASSGKMVTGWTQIDGKWYYFSKESNSLGQMLANTTVDGYKVNADGVWVK